jgi:hypothetical protein
MTTYDWGFAAGILLLASLVVWVIVMSQGDDPPRDGGAA